MPHKPTAHPHWATRKITGDINFDRLTRNELYHLCKIMAKGMQGILRRLDKEKDRILLK